MSESPRTFWDHYFSIPQLHQNGVVLPLRQLLNFIGADGCAVDNPTLGRTDITLSVSDGAAPRDESGTGTLDDVVTTTTGTPVRAVRFTGTGTTTVTGFASGSARKTVLPIFAVNGPLVLKEQDAGSSAANRIITGTGDVTIPTGGGALLFNDPATTRWRVIAAGGSGTELGWFNVMDYGAVPDGVTDNTAAFAAAIAASGASVPYVGGSSGPPFGGCVFVPHAADAYYFASDLNLTREVYLRGGGGPQNQHNVAMLKFAAGKGVVVHSSATATPIESGGKAEDSIIENLRIVCTPLAHSATPTSVGVSVRANSQAYTVGQKVRLKNDNRFYYECTTGGTTAASSPFGGDTLTDGEFSANAGRQWDISTVDGTVTWLCKWANGITLYNRCLVRDCTIEDATNAGIGTYGNTGHTPATNTNFSLFERVKVFNCGVGIHLFGNDGSQNAVRSCLLVGIGATYNEAVLAGAGLGGFGIVDAAFLGSYVDHVDAESGTGRGVWCPTGTVNASVYADCYIEDFLPCFINGLVLGGDIGAGFAASSPHTGHEWIDGWRRVWTQHRQITKKPQVRWDEAAVKGFWARYTDDDPGYATIADRYYTQDYPALDAGVGVGSWVTGVIGTLGERRIVGITGSGRNANGGNGGSREGVGNFRVFRGEFRGDDLDPYFVGYAADSKTDAFVRREQGVGGHWKQGDRVENPAAVAGVFGEVVTDEGWTAPSSWQASDVVKTYDSYLGGEPSRAVTPTTPNGYCYVCTKDGTTHASVEPTWPTAYINSTGGIVPYKWAIGQRRKIGDYGGPTTRNGHVYQVTAVSSPDVDGYGAVGGSEPTWPTGGGTVVDGQITWEDQDGFGDAGTYVADGTTEWQCVGPTPTFVPYEDAGGCAEPAEVHQVKLEWKDAACTEAPGAPNIAVESIRADVDDTSGATLQTIYTLTIPAAAAATANVVTVDLMIIGGGASGGGGGHASIKVSRSFRVLDDGALSAMDAADVDPKSRGALAGLTASCADITTDGEVQITPTGASGTYKWSIVGQIVTRLGVADDS